MLQMNRVMDITIPDPFTLLCAQNCYSGERPQISFYLRAVAIQDGYMLFTPFRVGRLQLLHLKLRASLQIPTGAGFPSYCFRHGNRAGSKIHPLLDLKRRLSKVD